MPGGITGAKTRLFIGTVHDAADEVLADFDALNPPWVEVGDITNFSEFGTTYQEITSEAIGNDAVEKYKGMRNDGTLQLTVNRVPGDTGQAAIRTALNSYEDYDFKIELNDLPSGLGAKPTRFYIVGKVMSYTTNIGGANNMVTATVSIAINGAVIEGAKVAGT